MQSSGDSIKIIVKQTGQQYLFDLKFGQICQLLNYEPDQTQFRVSNEFLNWQHLPTIYQLLKIHNFDPSRIQLIKKQTSDNWVHQFDQKTQSIIGSLEDNIVKAYQMLKLADYLGIKIVQRSYHFPGLTTKSVDQFKKKFNLPNQTQMSLEFKKKHYQIFEAFNYLYVLTAEEKMKIYKEKGKDKKRNFPIIQWREM